MPHHKRWLAWFWTLPLLLALPRQLHAAQAPALPAAPARDADDDADEKPLPFSNLSVQVSENGDLHVAFLSFGESISPQSAETAVGNTLGCKIASVSRFPQLANSYHSFDGSCHVQLSGTRFLRQLQINLAPLLAYARSQNSHRLSLTFNLPDTEISESQPPSNLNPFFNTKLAAKYRQHVSRNREYSWTLDSPVPAAVSVSFGYSKNYVFRAGASILAVLLAPLFLVFWLGRKALSAQTQDKSVVWFSYMRFLQWTLTGTLIGWWIASESVHLPALLKFLSTAAWLRHAWESPVSLAIVQWIPPVIVWVLGFALSHPVQEKLRGLTWTRREIFLQGVFSVCSALLPVAMFLTGLEMLGTSNSRWAAVCFLAAFFTFVFAGRALRKVMGTEAQALTTGELRDHAFVMAQQLGAKLQQVYVIPSGKGQMANAFARTGNTIAFTDFLLQRMSRREVNYILGHELTHIKLGHPGKIATARILSIFGAIFILSFLTPFLFESPVLRYAIILVFVTLVPLFWARRFEYAADAGAVAATGDPQAAISALFKLSSLNMMPFHWSNWSEKWLTHPSSLRRAQAIAHKAGIPIEQITEIARSSVAPADHYSLPPTVALGVKVLSSQRKQSAALRVTFGLLAAIIFTPAVFALLAGHFARRTPLHELLYLAGLPATLFAYLLFANFGPPMGLLSIVAALKQKLAAQNILSDAWAGIPVGFAPAAAPRLYELNANWDIGCLFLRSDRLCYWGEETQFALRRDQITSIVLAPGLPGLLRPSRIFLAWKDSQTGVTGALNWGCIEGKSTLGLRRKTSDLAARLHLWWKSSGDARQLPAPLAALGLPSIGAVTGVNPRANWKPGKIIKELIWTAAFAIVGAMLCSLPFHLLAYLLSVPMAAAGLPATIRSPGAGWYVVAIAVLMRSIALFQVLRHKDVPVVEASQVPLSSTAASSPVSGEEQLKPGQEPTLVK